MGNRVFLVHGWEGTPNNHWFPWLRAELIARGFRVFAPHMPNAAHPKVAEWLSMLREWVGKPDAETYFVGHSLGCIAIARYLAALPPRVNVGGAVFVAGDSGNVSIPEIAEFYTLPFDPEKARTHGGRFVAIFSDNDTLVPLERATAFAEELRAKAVIERGKGHFTRGDGVAALHSVLAALLEFSSLAERHAVN